MALLDGLRSGGRIVGVVSHVADLRARIPHQLVVTKTPDGSTVDVVRDDAPAPHRLSGFRATAAVSSRGLGRRAGADQIPVPEGTINTPHGCQYFAVGSTPGGRRPRLGHEAVHSLGQGFRPCGGVPQHAVGGLDRASRDLVDLAPIAIIASQNRSSSPLSSDSVGSTIRVPATGKDIVGAWNP